MKTKALRELSQREETFIEEYVKDGNHRRACIEAGYKDARGAAALVRRLSDHIAQRVFLRIGSHVPEAIKTLHQLMQSSASDQVRMKCAIEILNKAGFDQPREVIYSKDETLGTKEEFIAEVKELLEEVMGKDEQRDAVVMRIIDGAKK